MEDSEILQRIGTCHFCGKKFTRKSWFFKHSCPKKKKFDMIDELVEIQAFRLYEYWMRKSGLLRRGRKANFEKFKNNSLKKIFEQVIVFVSEQQLVSAYSYIDWLIASNKHVKRWCSSTSSELQQFIAYSIELESPLHQAERTATEIFKWVIEKPERTVDMFFDKLTAGRIYTLVAEQKILPWALFGYERISEKWLEGDGYDVDVYYRIDNMINCGYWIKKINDEVDGIEVVYDVIDDMLAKIDEST